MMKPLLKAYYIFVSDKLLPESVEVMEIVSSWFDVFGKQQWNLIVYSIFFFLAQCLNCKL